MTRSRVEGPSEKYMEEIAMTPTDLGPAHYRDRRKSFRENGGNQGAIVEGIRDIDRESWID